MIFFVMNRIVQLVLYGCLCFSTVCYASSGVNKYEPTWESLDARPLPLWYDDAKIGIFLHWGVFSVPGYGNEWFWHNWKTSPPNSSYRIFMEENYKPDFTYAEFAPQFTAELFDPNHWADLFQKAGAKYLVLTSKHHEGYCNWATNVSFNWNSMAVGPNRDLVAELAEAIRNRTDIRFGLYHSMLEWFHPLYMKDKENKFQTQLFPPAKTIPELHELVTAYKPEVIWSDGDWEASDDYWTSRNFLAWLYNESPVRDTVVVNDRWGSNCRCKHGGFYNCHDRYNPGVLQPHKWENAMTVDKGSWGYRRNVDIGSFLTMSELLTTMAETISCGGNLLVNVGPTPDGRIIPAFEERLTQMGAWLNVNGEAVYESKPWIHQNDTVTSGIWYTQKKSASSQSGYSVYAFVLSWPEDNMLKLGAPIFASNTQVHMLGYSTSLKYQVVGDSVQITFPFIPPNRMPSNDAWVLKFDNLKNSWRGYF